MTETTSNNEPVINTDPWYAIFSGWLILPALVTFFAFLGAIIMVSVVNPTELVGFDLVIYSADLLTLPLLVAVYYTWFTRKRIFPKLIIVFFIFSGALNIAYFAKGYGIDLVNLAMSVVWIIYFIKAKRVKAIFIK